MRNTTTFAAYDSKKSTVYIKGEIDVDEALSKLAQIYPELSDAKPRLLLAQGE